MGKSQEFIDAITEILAEGFSLQTKSTDITLKKYFHKVTDFLCQETTDGGDAMYWKSLLYMTPIDINGEIAKGRFSSEEELYQAKLQSIIDILIAFKSKEESKLQLEEMKKQTKSSQRAVKISIAGLIIALIIQSITQTCSHDLKFEKQQFDTLIQSIERKTPEVELLNDSINIE